MMLDIENFKPVFVRIKRAKGDILLFDWNNGEYLARDKSKYLDLKLNILLEQLKSEQAIYEYHLSVKSVDKDRAILVYESDKKEGEAVIKKLAILLRVRGIKFILKTSGNRSLHLIVPTIARNEEEYKALWNSVFYLLNAEERELIDMQLNNYKGQIRGFESLNLKTDNKSEVFEDD